MYQNIGMAQQGVSTQVQPGYFALSGGGTPDQIAANVTRDQFMHYMQTFAPLEQQLTSDINSDRLVTQAREAAQQQVAASTGSMNRSISRYGAGNAPGALQQRLARQQSLGSAEASAQAVNNARLEQRDRNLSLSSGLLQIGRGVAAQGVGGLTDVAGNYSARQAANAQNKAAAKSQNISTIGSLASTAAFMAFAGL